MIAARRPSDDQNTQKNSGIEFGPRNNVLSALLFCDILRGGNYKLTLRPTRE